MKAFIYTKYGLPDALALAEVNKPKPGANNVLVKVQAVSLNASDWELLTGKPFYSRVYGLFKPRKHILGSDISGVVEAVGTQVTKFKPGDEVFGDAFEYFGGFAEYVCVPEKVMFHKPTYLSFEQAATIPQAACIALQGIRDKGQIKTGQRILINGAGGGSGVFAIQLAKMYGAEVTAVDNADKQDVMLTAGADHILDYKKTDFTTNTEKYDFIFDLAAYHSIFDYKRVLAAKGTYTMVGGSMKTVFQTLFIGSLLSILGRKKYTMLALKKNHDMEHILNLIESGQLRIFIDKHFPFAKTIEALKYFGAGHAKGKVVINV